jgi:hypothetical protein
MYKQMGSVNGNLLKQPLRHNGAYLKNNEGKENVLTL